MNYRQPMTLIYIMRFNLSYKAKMQIIGYVKSTLASIKIDKQDAENYDSVYVEITHNNKKLSRRHCSI